MINYIIQVMLFQTLFLAVYDLALSKETFFTKNRWYLLVTAIGSFLIPMIKLPNFVKTVPQEINIFLPEIVLSPQSVIQKSSIYQNFNYGSLIFWIGFSLALIVFIYRLYKLVSLIFKDSTKLEEGYSLIMIPNSKKAFSFFNCVFIGENIHEDEKEKIISHELVHCKQKHSLDLLIFESLKIVMWYNPLLYVYQKRVSTVHEYISDSIVVESIEKKEYLNNLVNQLFDVEKISFVNQFYQSSLIKKRILMITKKKSKQINQVKYLLLIPILASMMLYSSCSSQEEQELELQNELQVESLDELVISEEEREAIPFTKIDEVPTFQGCDKNDRDCFNKAIQRHFITQFDKGIIDQLELKPGKKRIIMKFTIDEKGKIKEIKVKAPHPRLKEEVERIVSNIPIMEPGKYQGKVVGVKYTMPMRIDVK